MAKAKHNGHLQLDPRNARRHSDRNKRAIRQSLEAVGGFRSIAVDGQNIIRAGNGVYEAAQEMGLKVRVVDAKRDELIAVRRTDLKGKDAIRAAALDNIVSDTSYADYDADILASIAKDDELVASLAREDKAIAALLAKAEPQAEKVDPATLIDKAAELQKKWQVKRGDIWQVGKHRLMVGDCTKRENIVTLMGDEKADLLCADPPYGKLKIFNGAGKVGNWNYGVAPKQAYGKYDGEGTFEAQPWLDAIKDFYGKSVIWGGNYFANVLPISSAWLIWDKRAGDRSLYSQFEMAWSDLPVNAKMFSYVWQGMIREGEKESRLHPTQKPIELIEWILTDLYPRAQIVLDTFIGSGTTLLACERQGKICRAMDISPKYAAVAIERWVNLAGGTPRRLNG